MRGRRHRPGVGPAGGGADEAGGPRFRGPRLSPETHPFFSTNRGVCPVERL